MCQFTRILWTKCNHSLLSSLSEHTLLCFCATEFKLKQGIHGAPASCVPLPNDLENLGGNYANNTIAQTHHMFNFCDVCKADPNIAPDVHKVATPLVPAVEEKSSYSDNDVMEIADLRDLLLSCVHQAEDAAHTFDSLLTTRPEPTRTAIETIRNQTIRNLLLISDETKYFHFFSKSFQEAEELLGVLELYINIRVPAKMTSELYGLARNKLYQADARRSIFCELVENLGAYGTGTGAFEAAISGSAEKLAIRLGQVVVPDADAFAHLKVEEPLYAQRTVEMKESVRGHFIKGQEPVITHSYTPRSSFGSGRNRNALSVDTHLAMKPPPETKDIPTLRKIGDTLDIVCVEGLETRSSLSPLGIGQGPWGIADVLEQQRSYEDSKKTLLDSWKEERTSSPHDLKSSGHASRASDKTVIRGEPIEKDTTLPAYTTFFGQALPDTDSEVSDNDVNDKRERADAQGASREDSALMIEDKVWTRDENGIMVKKRKCSG